MAEWLAFGGNFHIDASLAHIAVMLLGNGKILQGKRLFFEKDSGYFLLMQASCFRTRILLFGSALARGIAE